MITPLVDSYAYCVELSKRTAGNFYYAFRTLPAEQKRAMCALYAFMRISDDIGDDESATVEQKTVRLREWRQQFDAACAGDVNTHAAFPAVADLIRRHNIPTKYFHAVLDGIESDLHFEGFETFDDLARYCYQVAGAVGVCCIHVWGFDDERAIERAVDCGTAFQLTNILRDLGEDAAMGRTYLPREDLARFNLTGIDLADCRDDDRFQKLMQFQVDRAQSYYEKSKILHDLIARPSRPIFSAMMRIYGGLLTEIQRRKYDVFSKRVTLSKWRKMRISMGAVVRHRLLSLR